MKNMTKKEAIEAMRNGRKVTHRNFTSDEWMVGSDIGYMFEDGFLCSEEEFWGFRTDEAWLEDWKLYI